MKHIFKKLPYAQLRFTAATPFKDIRNLDQLSMMCFAQDLEQNSDADGFEFDTFQDLGTDEKHA